MKQYALALTALLALSGCHGHYSRDPARIAHYVSEHVDDVLDDLDAKPEQRTKTQQITGRLIKDGTELMKEHEGFKKELLAQWASPSPDAAKVHSVLDARIDQFRAFAHKLADGAIEIHGI